jgi:hypothetical protein
MMEENKLLFKIRVMLGVVIAGLLITTIAAFPIVTNIQLLDKVVGEGTAIGNFLPPLGEWITYASSTVAELDRQHPFLFYASDWMVFAHMVIAIVFIGPWRDPVKNIWVIEWGMIACLVIIPTAMIAGEVREIPFFWRLVDSMFGVLCIIPLYLVRKWTIALAR